MPIVERVLATYKTWIALCSNIPKQTRFTLGAKIDSLFLEILELLFTASYLGKEQKLPVLRKANGALDILKFFLQIGWELRSLDTKHYTDISQSINEIGKMLGGWRKGLESKTPAM